MMTAGVLGSVLARWGAGALPEAGVLTLRVMTPNCTRHRWHSSASTQSGAWGGAESSHTPLPSRTTPALHRCAHRTAANPLQTRLKEGSPSKSVFFSF